ncbi:MAG TPA: hypothetical protein PLE01_08025, partial [Syntrophothermus lipocalidus]|nr:hypothetical protein [Syntrophothermus lipocalidus]
LTDDSDNILAASEKKTMEEAQPYWYGHLYAVQHPLPPGEYPLKVLIDGAPVCTVKTGQGNGDTFVVMVTDAVLVTSVNTSASWEVLGREPAKGDTTVYVEINAYGVSSPEDLTVKVLGGGDEEGYEDITSSAQGWLTGRDGNGYSTFLYRIELTEPLAEGISYNIHIAGSGTEEVVFGQYAQNPFFLVTSSPRIYAVRAADPAVGKIEAKLVDFQAGSLRAVLSRAKAGSGWNQEYEQVTELSDVSYDGGGTLSLDFTKEGTPLYLAEGTYKLELNQDQNTAQQSFSVGYADDYYQEKHEAPALLWVKPVDVLAFNSSDENVAVEALVANIKEEPAPVLELVQMGRSGEVEKVVALASNIMVTEGFDPKGYRFSKVYKLSGSITIPANVSDEWEYRWRLTCQNADGEERTMFYSTPVEARLGPRVGQVIVKNGLSTGEGGQMYPEGMPEGGSGGGTYLIGNQESEIDFTLKKLFRIDDLDKLTVELQDSNNQVVGSLLDESLSTSDDSIDGVLDISGSLADGEAYNLVVKYEGQEAGRTIINVSSVSGAESLSLNEGMLGHFLPAGSSFQVKVIGALNLDASSLGVNLVPLDARQEDQPSIETSAVRDGTDINIDCTASQSLSGWYQMRIMHGSQPLKQLSLYQGTIEDFEFSWPAV